MPDSNPVFNYSIKTRFPPWSTLTCTTSLLLLGSPFPLLGDAASGGLEPCGSWINQEAKDGWSPGLRSVCSPAVVCVTSGNPLK